MFKVFSVCYSRLFDLKTEKSCSKTEKLETEIRNTEDIYLDLFLVDVPEIFVSGPNFWENTEQRWVWLFTNFT